MYYNLLIFICEMQDSYFRLDNGVVGLVHYMLLDWNHPKNTDYSALKRGSLSF